MSALRKCLLCKRSLSIQELEKVGKGYMCSDRMRCYKVLLREKG